MKGLLIKDFMLFKNQKQFFAICILIGGAFLGFYNNPDFVISYVSIMLTMFTISTITYDEYENGLVYLFTLPISRRRYVTEKYIFGALTTICSLIIISGLAWIAVWIRHLEYSLENWGVSLVSSIAVITVFLCLMIPLQLKFKAEQSRIALLVVVGLFMLVLFLLVKFAGPVGMNAVRWFDRMINERLAVLFVCWAAGEIAVIAVSYLISLRIMEKKEL